MTLELSGNQVNAPSWGIAYYHHSDVVYAPREQL